MRINFESFSALQYRNKALSRQVEEFKSGEKYIKMEADYKKLLRFHSQEMKRMKQELAKAHSETVTVRRYWGEVMDDLDKEHQAEVSRLVAKIKSLEKENLEPARQRDAAKDKIKAVSYHISQPTKQAGNLDGGFCLKKKKQIERLCNRMTSTACNTTCLNQ